MTPGPRPHDLLDNLGALVLADGSPCELVGCLRIGVAYPTGDQWLELRFDGESAWVGQPRERGADTTVLLGTYEARRILAGRRLPTAPLFSVQGDAELYARFVRRYLSDARWVGLQPSEGRTRPARAASTVGRQMQPSM